MGIMEPDSLFTLDLALDRFNCKWSPKRPIRPGISEKSNIIEEPSSRFRRVRPIDL